jgi:hypothetical protein
MKMNTQRVTMVIEVRDNPQDEWKERYFVADLGNGYCLAVTDVAEGRWANPRSQMDKRDFMIWKYWRKWGEKTQRPMNHEEIFIAIQNGAVIKHIKSNEYQNYWNSGYKTDNYHISYDFKEVSIKKATWAPLTIEEE